MRATLKPWVGHLRPAGRVLDASTLQYTRNRLPVVSFTELGFYNLSTCK